MLYHNAWKNKIRFYLNSQLWLRPPKTYGGLSLTGFTTLELVLVIAVFSIIAAMGFSSLYGYESIILAAAADSLAADIRYTQFLAMNMHYDDGSVSPGNLVLDLSDYQVQPESNSYRVVSDSQQAIDIGGELVIDYQPIEISAGEPLAVSFEQNNDYKGIIIKNINLNSACANNCFALHFEGATGKVSTGTWQLDETQ
ncbi:MAG: type II secretion system protein, partial [Candidatus Omnitrophota bacterium]